LLLLIAYFFNRQNLAATLRGMIMIRLFPTDTTKKQLFLKKFLLLLFICASVATWIGIATIQADDIDPGDYKENTELNFQNAAQKQHAKNIAISAALKDPEVIDAISEAKDRGDFDAARTEFRKAVWAYMQEISQKRDEGEGWGNIAKYYGVHPKYLGLGHFKNKEEFSGHNYGSQNKDRGFALGHSKEKGGGHGVGHGGGNGHGNGGGNGGGRGSGGKQ
jgi:uncharacterized membrane protein YgcG